MEVFYRVYRLPEKLTDGFCFGGGRPIAFLNVDWFNSPPDFTPTREQLESEIKRKLYYDPKARFLVLDTRPGESFVIEPEAV